MIHERTIAQTNQKWFNNLNIQRWSSFVYRTHLSWMILFAIEITIQFCWAFDFCIWCWIQHYGFACQHCFAQTNASQSELLKSCSPIDVHDAENLCNIHCLTANEERRRKMPKQWTIEVIVYKCKYYHYAGDFIHFDNIILDRLTFVFLSLSLLSFESENKTINIHWKVNVVRCTVFSVVNSIGFVFDIWNSAIVRRKHKTRILFFLYTWFLFIYFIFSFFFFLCLIRFSHRTLWSYS